MMRKFFFFLVMGIVIETLAVLSFVGIAGTAFSVPGKQITVAVFLIAIIVLLVVSVRLFSLRLLVLLSAFLAIGATCVYQILGFAFFPGLVKDIASLSLEHFKTAGIVTLVIFCCYMGGIFVIVALRRWISKSQERPRITK
jgi:hypothetical protein